MKTETKLNVITKAMGANSRIDIQIQPSAKYDLINGGELECNEELNPANCWLACEYDQYVQYCECRPFYVELHLINRCHIHSEVCSASGEEAFFLKSMRIFLNICLGLVFLSFFFTVTNSNAILHFGIIFKLLARAANRSML
jgi:hypothetical protein